MWKQHKEVHVYVFVGKYYINVTLVSSIVICKECGETSDQRTQDLHLQLYAGVSKQLSFFVPLLEHCVFVTHYSLTYIQERRSVHVQDLLLEWLEEEVTSECDR